MGNWKWDNSRRSKSKVKLCKPNYQAKQAVQGDLYDGGFPIADVTAFFVTEGNGANGSTPIYIVVPDEATDMRNPLPSWPVSSSTKTSDTSAANSLVVTPCRNEW